MIIITMGVSGSGKTTVGRLLADRLGWRFYDADDFHPHANVNKMSAGVALTDEDRQPWLAQLRVLIENLVSARNDAVLACSALKEAYRRELAQGMVEVHFVYLKGNFSRIAERLRERRGHFMPADLLAEQFVALDEPTDALVIDIEEPVDTIVRQIIDQLPGRLV
jgi:gluconokinase